jgi:hypothetical protein
MKWFSFPKLANAGSWPKQLFGLMENEVQRSRATARALSNQADEGSAAPLGPTAFADAGDWHSRSTLSNLHAA